MSEPWKPAPYDEPDMMAMKALAAGVANEHQQKRVLKWIVEAACATYDQPYRPGVNGRDTDFACGRMFVGQQIVKLVNMDPRVFRKAPEAAPKARGSGRR